jgi:CRISPR-associated protein (TIGR02710 family)
MNNPAPTTLLITVGGSHTPILTAIGATAADRVLFICTGPDPATGRPGSETQVTGQGKVIQSERDQPADLPNIPTLAKLAADAWHTVTVPSDDLDQCYAAIGQALQREADSGRRLIADYTGGTKTMSAALVLAALDRNDVTLNLITGTRGNLRQVTDGSQTSVPAQVEATRFERALNTHLDAWRRYAYAEAAAGLTSMTPPANGTLRGQLNRALHLSRAFDAWDHFDHHAAQAILQDYTKVTGRNLSQHLPFLRSLCSADDHPRLQPARLLDLWLNAERRAAQGRWDDTVARLYRLLEWTAQWQLQARHGIDTADLKPDQLPADFAKAPARDDRIKTGLMGAWQLLAHHGNGPFADFATDQYKLMRDHIRHRNDSILAHGFTPVSEPQANHFYGWMKQELLPLLQQGAAETGVQSPPQLPRTPCW